jgi:hypothetical protein
MNDRGETPDPDRGELIQHPAKLLRITMMVRGLLEEVRQSPLDEAGRKRMREIYESSLTELKDALSENLQRELETLTIPLDRTPSESEIRVAQAQLVGWLEGLLHGIQAALWAQHMEAQAQLEQMRRHILPHKTPEAAEGEGPEGSPGGQYL